jgi:outer membrane protein OmpA-like peptidoglycan-associated protein
MKKDTRLFQGVALAAALSLAGCASMGDKQKKGTVIGAGGGAVLGGVIGHATGSTARGAIIGAAVGGAAGTLIGRRMDKQAEELARELPQGTQVSRVGEGIAVTFPEGILFPFDSATLRPEARDNLRELADSLRDNSQTEVLIVGHTDSKGTGDYNQSLSQRRARSAADYLNAQGVAGSRLRTDGRGENEPIASNDDESGRQRNRRVEVAIYADKAWREEARREAARN